MPNHKDYSALDHPAVLPYLFHPRPEPDDRRSPGDDFMIPTTGNTSIGACFHLAAPVSPTILYFHGNGEIAADYDDMGPVYTQQGINFLVVDYRGYGRSTGTPTVSSMMKDSHVIFDYVLDYLRSRNCNGPLAVMGRSMGSAPALDIAATGRDEIRGLIIESGFATISPLLTILGVDPRRIGFHESKGFENLDKISRWHRPLLIIHAEFDTLIPFSDGAALYSSCPSDNKRLLRIEGADHNDIFLRGMRVYMDAVRRLVTSL